VDAQIKVLATQHNTPTKMRIDGDSEKHTGNQVGRSISKLAQYQIMYGCLGNKVAELLPGVWFTKHVATQLVCKGRC